MKQKKHIKHLKRFIILIICLFIFLSAFKFSFAQNIYQLGPNHYQVGIPTDELRHFAAPASYGRQRQSNWCWAACIQMVLNYHGVYISQEAIVTRVFGRLINSRANIGHIITALSGWAYQYNENPVIVRAYRVNRWSDVVRDLAYKRPLIVVLKNPTHGSHAYVLTAATYGVTYGNEPVFRKLVLRDPWPKNPSKIVMSAYNFRSRLQYILRVWVTPAN